MAAQEIGFYGGMALLISSITGPGLTTSSNSSTFTIGTSKLIILKFLSYFKRQDGLLLRLHSSSLAPCPVLPPFSSSKLCPPYAATKSSKRASSSAPSRIYIWGIGFERSLVLSMHAKEDLFNELADCRLVAYTAFPQNLRAQLRPGLVSEINQSGSPFDSYIIFSFGYLVAASMVLPLSMMSLVQNIRFQLASVATLFFVMPLEAIKAVLSALSSATFPSLPTVPSFIDELSRHVSIHKSIAFPILICMVLYLVIGLTGAASFQIGRSSDILATLSAADDNKALITIVNILFPIAVLVTSVPVFAIVIRYNLVRGNFCSNSGDIFVLHRDNSSASARSHSRSMHSIRRSFAGEVPHLITTVAEEETNMSTYEASTSPIVVVTSPAISRRGSLEYDNSGSKNSYEEIDISDLGQEASGSGLDPSSIPLRVVYSPAVSRNPSIGHTSNSPKPSVLSNVESASESVEQLLPPTSISPTSPSIEASFLSNNQVVRRRSLTASNIEAGLPTINAPSSPLRSASSPRSPTEGTSIQEQGYGDDRSPPVFMAFPERKWLQKIVVAKIALAIVTCCVLGNLVYTIVETARGNSPLGG
ncbi:hypothetical protein B7463_g5397, partial [Scytalidium lignicola]